MKCSVCQREMSAGALFCDGCGAPLTDLLITDTSFDTASPKSKLHWPKWSIYSLVTFAFCIVVCVMLIFMRSPKTPAISNSDPASSLNSSQTSSDPSSVKPTANAAYTKIFTDAAIPDRPASADLKKYDYQAYAKETESGYIEKWEFGYKGETLYALSRTFYITDDYVAAYYQKDSATVSDMTRFVNSFVSDPLPSQSFITVKRSVGTSHSVIILTAVKLDNPQNYKEVFGSDSTTVSYLNDWLISNGFETMYK